MKLAVPIVLLVAAAACVPEAVEPMRDGGPVQTSTTTDAGPSDAGTDSDAGVCDAGARDAGTAPRDAGVYDGGPVVDTDMDGIPDDEDPMPTSPNTLLFSDQFDDVGPEWIFSSVSMSIRPERSQLVVNRLEPFEREGWIGPQPTWGDYLIRTLIRVDRVGNDSSARSGHAGLIARVSQVTPSRYVTCGVDLKERELVLAEHEGTIATTLESVPGTFEPGQWLRINLRTEGPNYVCTVGGVELTARSTTFFAGSIGFRTYDSTFAADWVEVYEIF
ncbi:MAG: hypothetical protein RL846_39330 [Deltaproteobacteria bacterium]